MNAGKVPPNFLMYVFTIQKYLSAFLDVIFDLLIYTEGNVSLARTLPDLGEKTPGYTSEKLLSYHHRPIKLCNTSKE